ncbi:MAG: cobalamin-binding protein [Deltaproteobacteria bacterium]|nr:MAG: cobalamin-binding protein [Deltaproteobacteria bacterium]
MGKKTKGLFDLLGDLDEEAVLELVSAKLSAGEDPNLIINECQKGMLRVGELYEQNKYYVSGLIMAGEIMRQVVDLLEPALKKNPITTDRATILLATVQGDIHDTGKNLVGMLLKCNGFNVVDAGVDVAPEVLANMAEEISPDVIGLSVLLTTAFEAMRDTITFLRERLTVSSMAPGIIIGGGAVDESVCRFSGADQWATDASTGLILCKQILKERASK